MIRRSALALVFSMSAAPALAQACLDIDQITLSGVTLVAEADLQTQFAPRLDACVDFAAIEAFQEIVTLTYVDLGFVAARAYLPEQDISDGELEIVVIEGQISDIVVTQNGSSRPARRFTAFPGLIDDPLNLRELEQGIAQISRLPASDASIELLPGEETGDTIVAVEVVQGRPWQASLSANNRGSSTTGRYSLSASFSYENLLGINDLWSASYQRSTEPSPFAINAEYPLSQSVSFSGSVPYGYWTFGVAASASSYQIEIPSNVAPIENTGRSASLRLSVDRLLYLDETGRWDIGAALTVKENENQILGTRIDTSSRRLSVIEAYISRTYALFSGQLTSSLTWRQGVSNLFNALDDATTPDNSPTAQYTAVLLDAGWTRGWQLGEQGIVLSSNLSAQFTNDRVFGSEQFSLGGFSGIRGTREALIFGNNAAQLTSTLSLPGVFEVPQLVSFTPYVGFDIGYVAPDSALDIQGGTLASYTLGLSLSGRHFSIDATYSDIFHTPDYVDPPDGGLFSLQAQIRL